MRVPGSQGEYNTNSTKQPEYSGWRNQIWRRKLLTHFLSNLRFLVSLSSWTWPRCLSTQLSIRLVSSARHKRDSGWRTYTYLPAVTLSCVFERSERGSMAISVTTMAPILRTERCENMLSMVQVRVGIVESVVVVLKGHWFVALVLEIGGASLINRTSVFGFRKRSPILSITVNSVSTMASQLDDEPDSDSSSGSTRS